MRQKPVFTPHTSILHCFSLGVPRLLLGEQAIHKMLSRKARALLFYLAVTARAHARDSLTTLLWPEMSDRQARKNLRTVLPELRKVLADQIEITTDLVALVPNSYWSDIDAFRVALAAKESPIPKLATLQQALDLYQGEFLQGFHVRNAAPFEDWMIGEREQLRLLLIDGLSELTDHALAIQDYKTGIAAARRLLTVEPWLEHGYIQLMRLLLQSGQRGEALLQFETCQRLLRQEFGAEPGPEIRALAESIRQGGSGAITVASSQDDKPLHTTTPVHQLPPITPPITQQPLHNEVPHNLITPLAPFVGRVRELDFICQTVVDPECRLFTIIGPGGMGKTRLAERAARQLLDGQPTFFPDGIYLVPLAGIELYAEKNDSHRQEQSAPIFTAIANQIGCELQSDAPLQRQLQVHLRQRQMLLILDTFEHLFAETDAVVTLLTHVPTLTVIVTSRIRFNVRGEIVLTLNPLSVPVPHPLDDRVISHPNWGDLRARDRIGEKPGVGAGVITAWQTSEAVALFVQHAQRIHANFVVDRENIDAVIRICRLVGGLPLGIELAAGMLSIFSCSELADELSQGLAILQTDLQDLPAEQRTLQAVFARSWRLLNREEQTLLSKLAFFPGSFHRSAAQAVADATLPLLTRLVNQSLLNQSGHGRYVMHRSIRDFALARLEQQPSLLAALRNRYTHFYLGFLAQQEPVLHSKDHAAATTQIYLELDNLRCAWNWVTHKQERDLLQSALHALFLFYESQGIFAEALGCYSQMLHQFTHKHAAPTAAQDDKVAAPIAAQEDATPTLSALVGRLQIYVGLFSARLGRMEQAKEALCAGELLLRQTNDAFALTFCLAILGSLLRITDALQSKAYLTEAVQLAKVSGNEWLEILAVLLLGDTHYLAGNYAEAEVLYDQGYRLSQKLQWGWGLISGTRNLGRLKLALGAYGAAEEMLRHSLRLAQQEKQRNAYLEATLFLGETLRLQGRTEEAEHCFIESYRAATTSQFQLLISHALWAQGALAEQRGDYTAAKTLFEKCLATVHPNLWGQVLPTYGWALLGLGALDAARRYFTEVFTKADAHTRIPISLDAQVGLVVVDALEAQAVAPHQPALAEPTLQLLHAIATNPAATQETRDRIATLARFGLVARLPSHAHK